MASLCRKEENSKNVVGEGPGEPNGTCDTCGKSHANGSSLHVFSSVLALGSSGLKFVKRDMLVGDVF